ncbi:P2X purinoceptor 4-like isoform X1 [Mercenaria mercenaria]|uniref:P2X purinoceptor 4-like isoform X1 n=1 Tax=Mercenaria mercenaria TaxID=6596 RepID=UPI00234E4B20|nr:P2X purinoceptor 4-like isoform X1 [Mercenaria mercenaria]
MAAVVSKVISVFFEYDTPRIVHIKSKKVGIINRFLQLCIIGYVIGYAIIFKKGYQDFDNVQGAVTTKLKGVAQTHNLTNNTNGRIWDVADYVVPPQENNAFFVITNLIITDEQKIGICEEDIRIPGANCTSDPKVCKENEPLLAGDGFMTGKCINSSRDKGFQTCEVKAWCPTEDGSLKAPDPPALRIAENFTVFIKNSIEFPKFNVKRRNILGYDDDNELRNCRFKKDHAKYQFCPIFVLKDIAEYSGVDFAHLAYKGGVIQIIINWDCNIDYNVEDCIPEYSFRRLDSDEDILSKGYNFRYAHYYKDQTGVETRTLYKAYGIKFIVTLQGKAGKFSVVPLIINIGSGLAILSVATILCDIMVLYILKAKYLYRDKKYLQVEGDDAYKPEEKQYLLSKSSSHTDLQNCKVNCSEYFQLEIFYSKLRVL